jgi:Fe-S-cluster containining protein
VNTLLKDYLALLSKVDAHFAKLAKDHAADISCRRGCAKCCVAGIAVCRVELDHIADFMKERGIAKPANRKDGHCLFLGAGETCIIYEARPVVCRLWGAPLLYGKGISDEFPQAAAKRSAAEDEMMLACCSLNFKGRKKLAGDSVMNADVVHAALAAINKVYCSKVDKDSTDRVPMDDL